MQIYFIYKFQNIIRYGVTANIAAFHAAARGSIPRIGTPLCILKLLFSPSAVRGQRAERRAGELSANPYVKI